MQTKFIVNQNGREMGPFTESQLKKILSDNLIFPTDYFYDEEKKDWILVSERFMDLNPPATSPDPVPAQPQMHAQTQTPIQEPVETPVQTPIQEPVLFEANSHDHEPEHTQVQIVEKVKEPAPIKEQIDIKGHQKTRLDDVPLTDDTLRIGVMASEEIIISIPAPAENKAEPTPNAAHSGKIRLNGGIGKLSIQQVKAGLVSLKLKSDSGLELPSELSLTIQAATATQIKVDAPKQTRAGEEFSVVLTAMDSYDNVAVEFKGTFDVAFAGGKKEHRTAKFEKGTATVRFKPTVAESVSIQIKENGKSTVKVPSVIKLAVLPNVPVKLIAEGPREARAGEDFDLKITALDAYGNVVTDFKGEIELEVEALAKKVS